MAAKVTVQNQDQNQLHVTIVMVQAKLDPIKVFLQSNKPVRNVVAMGKKLVKLVLSAGAMGKIKAMKMFLSKFQKELMMELV